jgi:ABC-2 type transport system permease protein
MMKKEFIQMRRDRLTLYMLLLLPAIQLLIFGYAINTDVKHMPMAVYDQSHQEESRRLIQSFQNSQYFDITYYTRSSKEATELIDRGHAKAALIIPPDYALRLRAGKPTAVQVIIDASDPLVATSAVNAAGALGQTQALAIAVDTMKRHGVPTPKELPLDFRVRAWYNPDLASAIFIVPGLLGALLMMTTTSITAAAIVRERERGTLEQLIVTPIKRWELMLSKIAPYVLVAFTQMTLTLLLAYVVFDVPIRGNLLLLYFLSLIFMMDTLGLGILVSTIAKTQQQAMQMSFFIFLPSIYLSGLLFPIEGMPAFAQVFSYVIPLTYFLRILRGILLKGMGLSYLWEQVIPILIFGVVIFGMSVFRFRKKLG